MTVEGATWRVCVKLHCDCCSDRVTFTVLFTDPCHAHCVLWREGLRGFDWAFRDSLRRKQLNLTSDDARSHRPKARATLSSSCGPVLSFSQYNYTFLSVSHSQFTFLLPPPHLQLRSHLAPCVTNKTIYTCFSFFSFCKLSSLHTPDIHPLLCLSISLCLFFSLSLVLSCSHGNCWSFR